MMLDCAWGSWRVMSQRKGEEEEGERGEGEGEEKMPTYNYVNQSKKTGPCGHVYM